jgi:hypothetical protein
LSISLTGKGEQTFAGESCSDFPWSFSVDGSTSLEDVSQRSCSTSFWHQQVKLMGAVLILIVAWRMDSFWDESMCHVQETHGVGVFQDYVS